MIKDLKALRAHVHKRNQGLLRRRRRMYRYIREMGFTAGDAQLMCGWSQKRVDELVKARDEGPERTV